MKKNKNYLYRLIAAACILVSAFGWHDASAFPASRYASSSALSSGNWVKIKVSNSGMQFISNSQLQTMGFSDPSKVNVYGFGGRMISEVLDASHPDDLPLLPSVKTSGGIVFFGVDHILWKPATTGYYSHTMQPYAEASYYFLSDREAERPEMPVADLTAIADLEQADSFIERVVHEQDIFAPGNSGRTLLGEDLRSAQQLNFPLPGNIGGDASVVVAVGSRISNAAGVLRLSSTNSTLSQNSANIEAVNSSEQFMRSNVIRLNANKVSDALQLGLSFSTSGVITHVRLDYVEVKYERSLTLPSDQLYFYFNEPEAVTAVLKGVTSETEIWDVTEGHQPKKVKFSVSGSEARFRVDEGYREYVAFNPSKVTRQIENAGTVASQDIHGMESPDMLIISPQEYLAAAEKVAGIHREKDGMTVHVLTPEQIYNEFSSGTPDLSAFRKAMKMWYDRDMEEDGKQKIKYCLIFSRPSYDNKMATQMVKAAGYPRVPIWQSTTGYTENTSYSTDDYIGMLEDCEGNFSIGSATINVAVGRFPVRSVEEANAAAEKLISYINDPGRSSWRNNVMMIADDQDNGQHLSQSEGMYASMMAEGKGKDYQYERLYLDNFELKLTSVGLEYPEAKKRLMAKLEEGQALVTYIGHANTVSWTHEHLLNWYDITSFSNTKLPVLYAATCEFARWDDDPYSGGELLWAEPKTGFIAMICPSRAVLINLNGPFSAQFGKYALVRNEDGSPIRLGDSYVRTKNGGRGNDDNKLRYALLGDPAMKMPVYDYNIETTSIYDVDITDPEADIPTIEARSNPKIKGIVTDAEGNKAEDFNGFVYIKLYDAERVIETLGNGDNGKVMMYNDRKTKLYDGVTQVENGEWEATIFMPSEIENNYTPGRITYYAVADDGREANGATDKFYVYGYDENAPEDNEGPKIINFLLNHENFKDGDVSYKTPVVYATVSDESGINLSDAGIGHGLTLTLDDKTVYSDIMNFYSPDLFDNTKGSFIYQLPEIEAGKHTLKLAVWDCANNSSYATISFNVAAVKVPEVFDISTEFKADGTGVEFIVSSDRPMASLNCNLEVFDINGTRIWHNSSSGRTDASSSIRLFWDFTTSGGNRAAKGIYTCRATVESPEGKTAAKSKKIVLTR